MTSTLSARAGAEIQEDVLQGVQEALRAQGDAVQDGQGEPLRARCVIFDDDARREKPYERIVVGERLARRRDRRTRCGVR